MNETASFMIAFTIGFTLGVLVNVVLVFTTLVPSLERNAIKHNAAHYDQKTGAFTWNDAVESK